MLIGYQFQVDCTSAELSIRTTTNDVFMVLSKEYVQCVALDVYLNFASTIIALPPAELP